MTTLHVVREAQSRWARASTAERRAHPDNKRLEAFFRNNGIEDRSFDPSIKEVWQDRKGGKRQYFDPFVFAFAHTPTAANRADYANAARSFVLIVHFRRLCTFDVCVRNGASGRAPR